MLIIYKKQLHIHHQAIHNFNKFYKSKMLNKSSEKNLNNFVFIFRILCQVTKIIIALKSLYEIKCKSSSCIISLIIYSIYNTTYEQNHD